MTTTKKKEVRREEVSQDINSSWNPVDHAVMLPSLTFGLGADTLAPIKHDCCTNS